MQVSVAPPVTVLGVDPKIVSLDTSVEASTPPLVIAFAASLPGGLLKDLTVSACSVLPSKDKLAASQIIPS